MAPQKVLVVVALAIAAVSAKPSWSYVPNRQYNCVGPFCGTVLESMSSGVQAKYAPGVAAAAGNSTTLLFKGTAGRFTYENWSAEVTNATLYDMASCTKVMATTTATAQLYQRGLLSLDMRVSDPSLLGPAFSAHGKRTITIRNLMLHNAGYPPDPEPGYSSVKFPCPNNLMYRPVLDYSCDQIIYEHLLHNQTLIHKPGEVYVYSDLSMITMMFVIGKIVRTNQLVPVANFPPTCANASSLICNFHAFVAVSVFQRYGMPNSAFAPDNTILIVPQWYSSNYHHEWVNGYVSDQNAYALGGISGHAGLFSNVEDCITLLSVWMFGTHPDSLNATTIALFIKQANATQSSRALGWDTNSQPNPANRSCGTLSPRTFLHVGFTGTQLCGDPERGVFTVLLANGRHPNFDYDGMITYRPIYNTLIQQLVDASKR